MIYFPLVCVIKFSTLKIMILNAIHEEVKAAVVATCGPCMAMASSHDENWSLSITLHYPTKPSGLGILFNMALKPATSKIRIGTKR